MASILDKYGIKEVADVVFYELDSKGAPSAPVLYLDTLKVSTIEQSAEVVDATGGKGNVKLISWDTNKEVTATFEDALFSVKSLAIMFGGRVTDNNKYDDQGKQTGCEQEVLKTVEPGVLVTAGDTDTEKQYWKIPIKAGTSTIEVFLKKTMGSYYVYKKESVVPVTYAENVAFDFMTFDLLDAVKAIPTGSETAEQVMATGLEINIDASTFGGTYYITGDTFARNYLSGKDEFMQFIIPKGKVSSEDLSLTMEADGDPATFSMSIKVLRAADGTMFKLVKYGLEDNSGKVDENKGVASVLGAYDKDKVQNAGYSTNPPASKVTTSKPESTNDMGN